MSEREFACDVERQGGCEGGESLVWFAWGAPGGAHTEAANNTKAPPWRPFPHVEKGPDRERAMRVWLVKTWPRSLEAPRFVMRRAATGPASDLTTPRQSGNPLARTCQRCEPKAKSCVRLCQWLQAAIDVTGSGEFFQCSYLKRRVTPPWRCR